MFAWIFRNRRRLEVIYGAPGRPRPLLEAVPLGEGTLRPGAPRFLVYEMIPRPRRDPFATDSGREDRRADESGREAA